MGRTEFHRMMAERKAYAPGPLQACLIASGTGFMMIAQGEPS